MAQEGLSFRQQLDKMRGTVAEMEKRRETERRLERERNEQALSKRLKEDTADALAQRAADLHKKFERDARKFYPFALLQAMEQEIIDFTEILRFYVDCMKQFPKVFTPQHKTALPALLKDMETLRAGLDKQLGQGRELQTVVDKVQFRTATPADSPAIVAAAKLFSERAHKVPLHIPNDFFAREVENFWVVETEGRILGYIKYHPADKALTFSLASEERINFNKFLRGVLYKFCAQGPLAEKPTAVRVLIAFVREVKFFTDLGFTRAETKGPTEWIYQRELA